MATQVGTQPRTQRATERAKALGLHRNLRVSERWALWLLLSIVLIALLTLLLVLTLQGRFSNLQPDHWAPIARGYTATGEVLGWTAAIAALLCFGFSLRKRWLQERMPILRGTMMGWLWIHVFAGLIALVAALLHAGVGLFDERFSTGKLIFWTLVLASLSGLIWRLVYTIVPAGVAAKIGNYSKAASEERAHQQALEIEKLAAGGSAQLHQYKDWLLQTPRSAHEMTQAQAAFANSAEAAVFSQLCALAQSRDRALARRVLQGQAVSKLQGWRLVHVPLSLAFVVLLPVHVVEVYDVAPKLLPPSARVNFPDTPRVSGHHDPEECGRCHKTIYDQWKHSMHAYAMASPITIAENNQVIERELANADSPDPKRICVNCHGPIDTELAQADILPFAGGEAMNRGVTCTTCHQMTGPSRPASGGFTDGVIAGLERGRVMYGPIAGAVGNPYHQSRLSPTMAKDPTHICQNCHEVHYDRDNTGLVEKGHDLVLQTTYREYLEYRENGGAFTCSECHMPVIAGLTRMADSARIPFDQDRQAPPREVHDHSFVGVDYPIDKPGSADPHREKRVDLLRRGAALSASAIRFDPQTRRASIDISISNVGSGHNLPTGFAFARQMWVELMVGDESRRLLFGSGILKNNTDDLCDANIFDDANSPIREFMVGCKKSDPQLVNIQLKLVDKADILRDAQRNPVENEKGELIPIAAEGASEQSIQRVAGNPVARKRPSDGQLLTPIEAGKTRRYSYTWVVPAGVTQMNARARLMFRNLPPYFLRDIADHQPPDEVPRLAPMISNLDVVEMASTTSKLVVPPAGDPR